MNRILEVQSRGQTEAWLITLMFISTTYRVVKAKYMQSRTRKSADLSVEGGGTLINSGKTHTSLFLDFTAESLPKHGMLFKVQTTTQAQLYLQQPNV
jgi:hypothetical protein